MDYCLDAGDGTASIWSGPAQLDLDGDGLFDDLLSDHDDDGLADQAMLDLDDDGTPEAGYSDDGSGSWAVSGGAADRPLRWFSLDGAEHSGPGDVDGDGAPDRFFDVDRDGLADRVVAGDVGYVDTDGDGRWDVMLTDSDGDGTADGAGQVAAR